MSQDIGVKAVSIRSKYKIILDVPDTEIKNIYTLGYALIYIFNSITNIISMI